MAAAYRPSEKSQHGALVTRRLAGTPCLREMRPLCQPEVRTPAHPATRHRQLLRIGNAVQPDRAGTEQLADVERNETHRGASRDHDVRTLADQDTDDLQDPHYQCDPLVALCIADAMKALSFVRDLECAVGIGRHVHDLAIGPRLAKATQLHPVSTAR